MREAFLEFEHQAFQDIHRKIREKAALVPPAVFEYMLETIKYHVNR